MLDNIDTDVIIRIEHLTAVDAADLGQFAFEVLRYRSDGEENPEFIFNQPLFRGAPILLAGPNFGCGSSREGAVFALAGLGVRCVIASGFGDIFYGNCFQNGLLPICLPDSQVISLAGEAMLGVTVTVDLAAKTIATASTIFRFEIDDQRRASLLQGLDDLGLTLTKMDSIRAWQAADRRARPWVWDTSSNT